MKKFQRLNRTAHELPVSPGQLSKLLTSYSQRSPCPRLRLRRAEHSDEKMCMQEKNREGERIFFMTKKSESPRLADLGLSLDLMRG